MTGFGSKSSTALTENVTGVPLGLVAFACDIPGYSGDWRNGVEREVVHERIARKPIHESSQRQSLIGSECDRERLIVERVSQKCCKEQPACANNGRIEFSQERILLGTETHLDWVLYWEIWRTGIAGHKDA